MISALGDFLLRIILDARLRAKSMILLAEDSLSKGINKKHLSVNIEPVKDFSLAP